MYILMIIGACVTLYFILRHLFRINPQIFTRYFFFTLVALLTLALTFLAISGRLSWLWALFVGLLPWARRLLVILRFAPLLRLLRGGGSRKSQQYTKQGTKQGMSRHEAVDILGLTEPFTKAEVIKAHRAMVQKLHPDRGGSNYLAAKINAAKDILLEQLDD